jgi:hypothetical protein
MTNKIILYTTWKEELNHYLIYHGMIEGKKNE